MRMANSTKAIVERRNLRHTAAERTLTAAETQPDSRLKEVILRERSRIRTKRLARREPNSRAFKRRIIREQLQPAAPATRAACPVSDGSLRLSECRRQHRRRTCGCNDPRKLSA